MEDMVVVLHGEEFNYGIGSYERSVDTREKRHPPRCHRMNVYIYIYSIYSMHTKARETFDFNFLLQRLME